MPPLKTYNKPEIPYLLFLIYKRRAKMSGSRKRKRARSLSSPSLQMDPSTSPEFEPEPETEPELEPVDTPCQLSLQDAEGNYSSPEHEPLVRWMPASWKSKKARVQPTSFRQPDPINIHSQIDLQDKDFPQVKFRDVEQFNRFQSLKVRRILATRFMSDECVTALGIKSDLEWLFNRVGWTSLMMNQYLTFQELTLEFLSSFQQKIIRVPKGQIAGVWFRMFNQEFYKTLDEFGDFFGLPRGGNVLYYDSDPSSVWKQITGISFYNPQSAKASRIHNPVFRYLQRLMANTIFGRHDSQGTVREWEMEMIQSMLYPDVHLSTAAYIARHFHAVGKSRKKSPVVIGGLITPIAVSLGFDLDHILPVGPIPTIDITKLVNMGWLHEDNDRYRWVVNKKPTFFLPCTERTTITNQANWEFPESFGSDGEEEKIVVNFEREYQTNSPPCFRHEADVGGSSPQPIPMLSPQSAPQSTDITSLLASLNSIHTGIQDILTSQQYMNQRMDQFDQMLYPIYNWHVEQGHINPNTLPYPDLHYPQHLYQPFNPPEK